VVRTIWREQAQLDAALDQTRLLRVPASVPVTVLSADRMNPKGTNQPMRDGMNELHARLAATSESGRHVVVAECGHLVPIDQPDAVVDEVLALVRAHRSR
jgi:pimeloyl-ACP methyl ester carboxylesterase